MPTWVITPVIFVSSSVVNWSTSSVPVTWRSLFGINTSPLPFARNSKSALLSVVSIIFPVILTFPLSKLPVKFMSPTCVTDPVCVIVPVIVVACRSVEPFTVSAWPNTTSFPCTVTSPVPLARNSKSLFDVVVVIKLSSICISPFEKVPPMLKFPVWFLSPTCVSVPVTLVSCNVVVPLTVKLLVITTSLVGTTISPVPFAVNCKSVSLEAAWIVLPLISISSTSRIPVIVKLPVCVWSPVCVTVPFIVVACRSVVPFTVKSCDKITSSFGINTSPLPLARNSKSVFVVVVSTTLPIILISWLYQVPVIS